MAIKTYTNQKYGFTKPYRDNLNKMNTTISKVNDLQKNEVNNLYNKEIARLNDTKEKYINSGNNISKTMLAQPTEYKNPNSIMNQTVGNRVFKGLNNKLSESSNINLMNNARAMSEQALNTTSTIIKGIEQDMQIAKATRDIDLAQSAKQKFDLMYDNFYQVNEAYLSNRELLQDLEG